MPNLTEREIDAEIAEKIFGFTRHWTGPDANGENNSEVLVRPGFNNSSYTFSPLGRVAFDCFVPHYSTSISDAFAVVEKMSKTGRFGFTQKDDERWFVEYRKGFWTSYVDVWMAQHESLPKAICLAALRASETHPIAQSVDSAHTQQKEKL